MSTPDRTDRGDLLMERLRQSAGEFVSGTELAQLLGVSRAAVGKRILALRRQGLEIDAVPNRGYRLMLEQDGLGPEDVTPLLNTRWLGRIYLPHDELESTNRTAAEMADEGAPHGTVIQADVQRAGRGRLGRSWHSPPGTNLYVSVVLRPKLDPATTPLLSLAAAVGVAHGVRGFVGQPPRLKWPNDLLYGSRKLSGILLEQRGEGGAVILGVGINVNLTELPEELQQVATSLKLERGSTARRAAVLASVLNSLEEWLDRLGSEGARPVLDAWTQLADWIGQRISVNTTSGTVEGVALGLAEDGALRLQLDDGQERRLFAGDVTLSGASR